MSELINFRDVYTGAELRDAVATLAEDANAWWEEIYVNTRTSDGIRLSLVEETLTDGSTVKNIIITPIGDYAS